MGGIIPACAGNTKATTVETSLNGDHPRMRGEHQSGWYPNTETAGSSPHARGTLSPVPHPQVPTGIIPACAGNTFDDCMHIREKRDHPRMRGEHMSDTIVFTSIMGSSPHARGTRRWRLPIRPAPGIIPACAGNTWKTMPIPRSSRDHPRMRGEHRLNRLRLSRLRGSSPHARGTQVHGLLQVLQSGIIPACAGNTEPRLALRLAMRDHPRMRGEHLGKPFELVGWQGSSPHARGTHRPSSAG